MLSMVSNKFLKAKPGDLFHDTVAGTVNNAPGNKPRVLVFVKLVEEDYTYPNGSTIKVGKVHFIDRSAGTEVVAPADDRYGYYPRLDKKAVEKLEMRRKEIAAELAKYDHLLTGIAFCAELKS